MGAKKVEESKDQKPIEKKAVGPPVFSRSGAKPAAKKEDNAGGAGGASSSWSRSNVPASKPAESKPSNDMGGGFARSTTNRKK